MIYYTTGKGINLNVRGLEVDVFEKTGESLVSKGILVRTKEELDENNIAEMQEIKQEQPTFVEKTEKIKVKKGRPSKK